MDIVDWEDIYIQLYAYTDQLLKTKTWFRTAGTDSYLKGKQVHDYVSEAIEKYLRNPEKYDPKYNRSLVNYLKKHIIRTLVGNDANSVENKTSSDIFSMSTDNPDDDDVGFTVDSLLPYAEAYFDQEIDYEKACAYVQSELGDDETALKIFHDRCEGVKRRQTIETHKISDTEYDNGMKRLHTVLKKTAAKYDLTK